MENNNIIINVKKLQGNLYWGRYTLKFDNGNVQFIRNIPKVVDCTRELNTLTFAELYDITNKLVGHTVASQFAEALKKLEK